MLITEETASFDYLSVVYRANHNGGYIMTEKEKKLFDWIRNSKDPDKALDFAIRVIEERLKKLSLPN